MDTKEMLEELKQRLAGDYGYGLETRNPAFFANLCREGSILDNEGNRMNPEDKNLEQNIAGLLSEGKPVFIYGARSAAPNMYGLSPDKKRMMVTNPIDEKNVKFVDDLNAPPKPGIFDRIADFFLKLGGSRSAACREYDEYEENLDFKMKVSQVEGLGEKLKQYKPERESQLRFRVKLQNANEVLTEDFNRIRDTHNFKDYRRLSTVAGTDRTPEDQRTINIFSPIDRMSSILLQEAEVIAAADKTRILGREESAAFYAKDAPDADAIKVLHEKCPANNLPNQSCISKLFEIEEGQGHDKYMQYIKSLSNVESKTDPEHVAEDTAYLRSIVAENIRSMNNTLRARGFTDDVKVPANDNGTAALARVSCSVDMKANATMQLAQYLYEKGENDPLMISMFDRAAGIKLFADNGKDWASKNEASLTGIYSSAPTIKESIDRYREMDYTVPKNIRKEISPERLADIDNEISKLVFNGMKPEASAAAAHKPEDMQKTAEIKVEPPKVEMPKGPMA